MRGVAFNVFHKTRSPVHGGANSKADGIVIIRDSRKWASPNSTLTVVILRVCQVLCVEKVFVAERTHAYQKSPHQVQESQGCDWSLKSCHLGEGGHFILRRMALVGRLCLALASRQKGSTSHRSVNDRGAVANLAQKGHRKVVIVFSDWVAALAQHSCQC